MPPCSGFQNPRPTVPWRAERDATREGPKCAQITVLAAQMEGEEDCLFLNVYSPNLDGPTMPVMVYIHGGGFVYGSGNAAENGPDFIVHHDVVLVTLNYRLGAMGTSLLLKACNGLTSSLRYTFYPAINNPFNFNPYLTYF